MKRGIILLGLSVLMMLASCQDTLVDYEYSTPNTDIASGSTPYIFDKKSLVFDSKASSQIVTITTELDWSIKSASKEWITPEKEDGNLKISVDASTNSSVQQGEVIITINGNDEMFAVRQAPGSSSFTTTPVDSAPTLSTTSPMILTSNEYCYEYEVSSNTPWSISEESGSSWISFEIDGVATNKASEGDVTLKITFDENLTIADLEATLQISLEGFIDPIEYEVEQSGAEPIFNITGDGETITLPYVSSYLYTADAMKYFKRPNTITVTANFSDWRLDINGGDGWLTLPAGFTPAAGPMAIDGYDLTFGVAFADGNERSATITITPPAASGLTAKSVTLRQAACTIHETSLADVATRSIANGDVVIISDAGDATTTQQYMALRRKLNDLSGSDHVTIVFPNLTKLPAGHSDLNGFEPKDENIAPFACTNQDNGNYTSRFTIIAPELVDMGERAIAWSNLTEAYMPKLKRLDKYSIGYSDKVTSVYLPEVERIAHEALSGYKNFSAPMYLPKASVVYYGGSDGIFNQTRLTTLVIANGDITLESDDMQNRNEPKWFIEGLNNNNPSGIDLYIGKNNGAEPKTSQWFGATFKSVTIVD